MDNPKKKYIIKVFFYGIVGLIGTAIHFLTLILLVEGFKQDPVISSSIGFLLTVIVSFILNKRFTFKINQGSTPALFIKYIIVSLIGFMLNSSIMYIAVHVYTIHYSIAQTIVVLIIPITNFLLNNYWTFNEKEKFNSI